MGNSQPNDPAEHIRDMFSVVSVDRVSGSSFIEEKHTGREFLLKEFSTNSTEEFTKLQSTLKMRQLNSHPQVLSVYDISSRTENNLCSHIHKLYMIVEHPFRTLAEEVRERKKQSEYFNENEVWSIVYSCALGLGFLYSRGYQHQALSSSRIYIENEGLIKISDPELLNQPNNLAYSKAPDQHAYLSPEQIEYIDNGRKESYSAEISDVFTLGMVVLEVAHLQWMDGVYNNGYVNKGKLQEVLASIPDQYSQILRDTVARMVRLDAKERITLKDIEKLVESSNF